MSKLPAATDELEVKARVADPAAVRRDEVLRLRVYRPADGSPAYGVLGWKGPHSARGGYRHRAELEARVADPDATLAILEHAGFRVSLEIDRTVEIYRLPGVVLRLEWYPAMDVLLEVEGGPRAIERGIVATGLPRADFLPESLKHFTAEYEARTGKSARVARRR